MTEQIQESPALELLDPESLQEPWRAIVRHWLHNHPTRLFFSDLDAPGSYRLTWDDLRDILITAGVLQDGMNVS